MKNQLTISQVAKICAVNRSTMNRWANSGKIKSYNTPGGHKRILFRDLKTFLLENKMPVDFSIIENQHRILVVDDDVTIQRYLKKILEGPFVVLDFTSDGFEAGKRLVVFKPQLLILDLSLPHMDGFEVCKNIKEDPSTSHIKILILTGRGTEENQKKAISLGADAFLSKPVAKKQIIDIVEQLLRASITNPIDQSEE